MWDTMNISLSDKQGSTDLAHPQPCDMIPNQIPGGLAFLPLIPALHRLNTPREVRLSEAF